MLKYDSVAARRRPGRSPSWQRGSRKRTRRSTASELHRTGTVLTQGGQLVVVVVAHANGLPGFECEKFMVIGDLRLKTYSLLLAALAKRAGHRHPLPPRHASRMLSPYLAASFGDGGAGARVTLFSFGRGHRGPIATIMGTTCQMASQRPAENLMREVLGHWGFAPRDQYSPSLCFD